MLSYRKTRELLFLRLSHFPGGERLIDEALTEALAPTRRNGGEAMSQVTMCDFCGTTTRQAAEVVKLKLPKAVVPEALQSRTASNATTDVQLDSCQACAGGIVEVLEEFMTRRFGGITEEDTA